MNSNNDRTQFSGSITRLAWGPFRNVGRADGIDEEQKELLLAVASDDNSLRIYSAS